MVRSLNFGVVMGFLGCFGAVRSLLSGLFDKMSCSEVRRLVREPAAAPITPILRDKLQLGITTIAGFGPRKTLICLALETRTDGGDCHGGTSRLARLLLLEGGFDGVVK
jgi:hypothetical protein